MFETKLFTFHPHSIGQRKVFMRGENRAHAIYTFGQTIGLMTRDVRGEQDDGSGNKYQDIEIGTGRFFTVYETLEGETEGKR